MRSEPQALVRENTEEKTRMMLSQCNLVHFSVWAYLQTDGSGGVLQQGPGMEMSHSLRGHVIDTEQLVSCLMDTQEHKPVLPYLREQSDRYITWPVILPDMYFSQTHWYQRL